MKQRLTGAITLGCLAIIFIPIILDGDGIAPAELNGDIPPSPAIPEPLVVEAERPTIIADATDSIPEPETATPDSVAENTPAAEPATEDTPSGVVVVDAEPATVPALGSDGLPESWSVRLASFALDANATALVDRLLTQNYKAYSRPIDSSRGTLTAVYVGPVLTRNEAQSLRGELAETFDLNGIIVEFEIAELSH